MAGMGRCLRKLLHVLPFFSPNIFALKPATQNGEWALSRALRLCAGDRGMHLACIDADAELRLITIDFKENPGIEGLATARN